jgi:mRNA-degrading endonuclease toxin of MazEF toxin-antitoxin module
MPVSRGDIVLAFVENVGAPGGKLRPALVVQSDRNNSRLNETIIAAITSNTSRVYEPHQLFIEVSTPEGGAPVCSTIRRFVVSGSTPYRSRISDATSVTCRLP